ncbi:hypothetical protein THRCLA_01200 [Thraustotheca clavata]|uniref:Uncharacterized protein n=1 Tax=Thraustotheca clavata TaxID=74557 RepID=A0A1W0A903_9STRA|nr:hypothetical protein THRCLA_01200 [Thraustotheca clavata]
MDQSTRLMVQSAALQARTNVPKAFEGEINRYRCMDATLIAKENEARRRMILELEAKRSKKSKQCERAFEKPLQGTRRREMRCRVEEEVENTSRHENNVVEDLNDTEILMKKIAQFKKAQSRDIEAVERLLREKNAAEAKARHLEKLLNESQPAMIHPFPTTSPEKSMKARKELVIDTQASYFDDITDDEAAPPEFDVLRFQTASAVEDLPAFDDFQQESPPKENPEDNVPQSTWATRISSVHSSFLTEKPEKQDHRKQSAFFEEKQRIKQEEIQRELEAKAKLERAKNATPFTGLLINEAKTQARKAKRIERAIAAKNEELKSFKARDPPVFDPVDHEAVNIERQKRVVARATALLSQSQLPPRLAQATPRRKKQSEETKTKVKVQPVPDFQAMQTEWKNKLQRAKSKRTTTQVEEFSLTRREKVDKIALKKKDRLERMTAKEREEEEAKELEKRKALQKALEAAKMTTKVATTMSHKLRTKAVQSKLKEQQKKEQSQEEASVARNERLKTIAKQVIAEVSDSERKRKEEKGNFVEISEAAAKAKAEENKKSFQEAIKRNKERIHAAATARPTLMERFAIDKKKEEQKRKALQSVMNNVFGKNMTAFKGILTEEEEELVSGVDAEDDNSKDDN